MFGLPFFHVKARSHKRLIITYLCGILPGNEELFARFARKFHQILIGFLFHLANVLHQLHPLGLMAEVLRAEKGKFFNGPSIFAIFQFDQYLRCLGGGEGNLRKSRCGFGRDN
jgi:hypothetical protein